MVSMALSKVVTCLLVKAMGKQNDYWVGGEEKEEAACFTYGQS